MRYLAIIHLKNGVDKYWRKTATNAIKKEEKELIKSRSVDAVLNEPNDQLALHSANFLSKVIRIEYPREW